MKSKLIFGKNETAIIKGVAILLMLIHHLFMNTEGINYYSQDFFNHLSSIGKICVSIFSFITGYGIYISYEKNSNLNAKKRITKLYIRYWIILLLIFLPMQILAGNFTLTLGTISDYFLNLTGFKTSLNPNAWFLRNWIVFIIIAPLFFKLINKISNIAIESILFIILPAVISLIWSNHFLDALSGILYYIVNEILFSILVYLPFFTMGSIIAKHRLFNKLFVWLDKKSNGVILIILSIAFLVLMYLVPINQFYIYGIYYSYLVVTPIFIITLVILANKLNVKVVNKLLSFFGKHSNNMWLIHGAFYVGIFQPLLYSVKYPLFIFFFLIAISLISSIFTEKIIDLFTLIKCKTPKKINLSLG